MGYTIKIGNATPYFDSDDDELYAKWTVQGIELPDAPSFKGDEVTGKGNTRSPSYTSWARFGEDNGLTTVFTDDTEGLMREHPGCFKLKPEHLTAFKEALARRELSDPRPAGYDESKKTILNETGELVQVDANGLDYDKVRLIWLIFWTEWALNNCKIPAMENT